MLFREVIGQHTLKEKLIQAIRQGRIPHAQLYHGEEGTGNLAVALAYAQYLNCMDRRQEDSCGNCPSCVQFARLAHPDLHFIYPVAATAEVKEKPVSRNFLPAWRDFIQRNHGYARLNDWLEHIGVERKQGTINVHDCNELVRTLGYTSYESEYKVMIIWMIEKLFHAAAPKLLKILEEPPEKTVFLLVTGNMDQILPTILSRTQLVRVPKITDPELESYLLGSGAGSAADITVAVSLSGGNYLEVQEQLALKEENEERYAEFRNWMLLCFQYDIPGLMKFTETLAKAPREKLKSFLYYGLHVFRFANQFNLLDTPKVSMQGGELEFVRKFRKYIHPDNLRPLYELINESIYHIERNAHTNLLLTDLSLKIGKLLNSRNVQKFS